MSDKPVYFVFSNLYHVTRVLKAEEEEWDTKNFWDKSGNYSCPKKIGHAYNHPTATFSSHSRKECEAYRSGQLDLRNAIADVTLYPA